MKCFSIICALIVVHLRPATAACTRDLIRQRRQGCCQYVKCVLQLEEKDRLDSKERQKECGLDDVAEGNDGCLLNFTPEIMDEVAEISAEGQLKIRDACQWCALYLNLMADAEEANLGVDPKKCQDICPPEECVGLDNSCITTGNRNQCLRLQEQGCENIVMLESCPLQFRCEANVQ